MNNRMKAQMPGRAAPRRTAQGWAVGIRFGLTLVLSLATNLVPVCTFTLNGAAAVTANVQ